MPASLPMTEDQERRPESAYSLSKLVGETIAEQYCRWDPTLKIISLRFSNVMLPEEYKNFEAWQEDPKARYWNCWYVCCRTVIDCYCMLMAVIVGDILMPEMEVKV